MDTKLVTYLTTEGTHQSFCNKFISLSFWVFLKHRKTADLCLNVYEFEKYGDRGDKLFHSLMSVHDPSYFDLYSDEVFENWEWQV